MKIYEQAVGGGKTSPTRNTAGTDPAAINLESSAGGVLVSADGDIANAIKLHATAGTNQTIVIENTAGNTAGAIALTSTVGGVAINGGTGVTIDAASAFDLLIILLIVAWCLYC